MRQTLCRLSFLSVEGKKRWLSDSGGPIIGLGGGGVLSADGDYGDGMIQRVKEAIHIAEETGATLQFSHLFTMPTEGDIDRIKAVTQLIEEAREKGYPA